MRTFRVKDILKDKILVSRESARLLQAPLNAMMVSVKTPANAPQITPLAVDFEDVEGIAPSFLDELLTIFESLLGAESNGKERCLIVANPPTRLSLKFEAVARGHGMSVRAQSDGSWLLSDSRNPMV